MPSFALNTETELKNEASPRRLCFGQRRRYDCFVSGTESQVGPVPVLGL